MAQTPPLLRLPAELRRQITLYLPSLDDYLALTHSCRAFATLRDDRTKLAWFTRQCMTPLPTTDEVLDWQIDDFMCTDGLEPEYEAIWASHSYGVDKQRGRAAAVLDIADEGLGLLQCFYDAHVRSPHLDPMVPLPAILGLVWEHILPWMLRSQIVISNDGDGALNVEEIVAWFDALVRDDGARYCGAYANVEYWQNAASLGQFTAESGQRFCRIAFRGALEQRKSRKRKMKASARMVTAEKKDGEESVANMEDINDAQQQAEDARAFNRLQTIVHTRIGEVLMPLAVVYES
ncbi:hypothetical protein HDU86_002411 [Geranomyces michiganensis]|nr:hypothetical protein HDU86_002411 [Geranomyces michiganensis]